MRIIDIMESENQDDLIKQIKDSKWYKKGALFYRGVSYHYPDIHKVIIGRDRKREPRDVDLKIHQTVNKLAFEKVGYNIRNGLFLSQSKDDLDVYGKLHLIFPLDDSYLFISEGVCDFLHEKTSEVDLLNYANGIKRIEPTDKHIKEEIMGFGTFILVSYDTAHKYGLDNQRDTYKNDIEELMRTKSNYDFCNNIPAFIEKHGFIPSVAVTRIANFPEHDMLGNYLLITQLRLYSDDDVLRNIFSSNTVLNRYVLCKVFMSYLSKHTDKLDILLERIASLSSNAELEGIIRPFFTKLGYRPEIVAYMRGKLPKYNKKAFEIFTKKDE